MKKNTVRVYDTMSKKYVEIEASEKVCTYYNRAQWNIDDNNHSEPDEEHRGLMVYFDDNPAVSEKVFSIIPSVKEINGELMGVFECQITE